MEAPREQAEPEGWRCWGCLRRPSQLHEQTEQELNLHPSAQLLRGSSVMRVCALSLGWGGGDAHGSERGPGRRAFVRSCDPRGGVPAFRQVASEGSAD